MYLETNENVLDFTSYAGKIPPQNIEAEESVLGGILFDPSAIDRVCDVLKPDHFYIKAHARIYEALLKLHLQEQPTDLIMLTNYLRENKLLDVVGGQNKLASLMTVPSATNIDAIANLIVRKWIRRQFGAIASLLNRYQYNEEVEIPTAMEEVENAFYKLRQGDGRQKTTHISDNLINLFEEIEERSKGMALPGIKSGFYDLDSMTQGFQRGDLIIIGARPSMGKTAFAANIAHNIAAAYKQSVVIFSLEMTKQQIIERLLSTKSGIEAGYLKEGRVTSTQWQSLAKGIGLLAEMPIFVNDSSCSTPSTIKSECLLIKREQQTDLGLIVVDYLQLMDGSGSDQRVTELDRITRDLKRVAKELQVPIICLSQLSRAVESRLNKRPVLSDLRESGGIEQNADLVMSIYRDEYYNLDTVDRGIAEICLLKHRNGPTGTVKLLFDSPLTQFKNLARPAKFKVD